MKFKPILFSTPMVQAILEGRKTQTRRIIKPQPDFDSAWKNYGSSDIPDINVSGSLLGVNNGTGGVGCCVPNVKIPVNPGDILWVRETFRLTDFLHPSDDNYGYVYKASENGREWESNDEGWIWKPSIFMPKAACRIFLLVTDVRVERLQDISENDCIAEGIENFVQDMEGLEAFRNYTVTEKELENDHWAHVADHAEHSFETLWQSINGKESWNENPWVWVYEFEQIKKPENFK